VVICSDCDRGRIYCADCAPHARRRSLRQAGRRYQASGRGRTKHAERSRRYRGRQNKVTHHGSPADRTDALLAVDPGGRQRTVASGQPAASVQAEMVLHALRSLLLGACAARLLAASGPSEQAKRTRA
jgi:hypothetical protein